MPKATWNGAVLAESNRCELVEGNHYFPPDSIRRQYLKESATHTVCSWKGEASYYDIVVNGQVNNVGNQGQRGKSGSEWNFTRVFPHLAHIF